MAKPVIPSKAKLFVGIITSSDAFLLSTERRLISKFGKIDYKTMGIPFVHTEYYNYMGTNLYKVFLSFEKLIKRDSIVKIKHFSNRIENKVSGKGRRRVNVDPGYLTLSNVYLATCKDFFHRVYLSKGIYLENEYKFVGRKYHPWEWTYPDYLQYQYLDFFHRMRDIYRNQLRMG